MTTDFERFGGEAALRAMIDDFVDRVFDDVMIGFHFRRADRERTKKHEYEHVARALGAEVPYTGRPLRKAHAAHTVLGGHFMRRRFLLIETARAHGMPEAMLERLVAHQDALRDEITMQPGSACID